MRKSKPFYLQHKFPWNSDWEDVEETTDLDSKVFYNLLKDEPDHLLEVEYRVIKKVAIKLRNKNKIIYNPECVLIGRDLTDYIEEIRSREG